MAGLFRDIRERFIAQLNASAALQAAGLSFVDLPDVTIEDLAKGERRGFVWLQEENEVGEGLLELRIVATGVVAGVDGKEAADLIDGIRDDVIAVFAADPELNGLIQFGRYIGSTPVEDGRGRRVYGGRHFWFAGRYMSPVGVGF